MREIGLAAQTMFAELIQQTMDAEFDEGYDERGNFVRKRVDGPLYWYYQRKVDGKLKQSYVGPVKDDEVNRRVRHFNDIKSDFSKRRSMVRALLAIGLPAPDSITGLIIEALWKAGFFRLRGVLVGTAAFQSYSGILGVKLSGVSLMTQDLDAAQFYDISRMVKDSMPPILDVLHTVDETFTSIPDTFSPTKVARFRSRKTGYMVEFLTPNRGSDKNSGKLAEMPALGGASAIPLRYLDYLIHEPVRSVALFKGCIPITVPSPQRYAIHKLMLPAVRSNQAKSPKDILQASQIIAAMQPARSLELYEAWTDAWGRGPSWRANLMQGLSMLDEALRDKFIVALQVHGWSDKKVLASSGKQAKPTTRKTPRKKMLKKLA
jgi:hypothetical protein